MRWLLERMWQKWRQLEIDIKPLPRDGAHQQRGCALPQSGQSCGLGRFRIHRFNLTSGENFEAIATKISHYLTGIYPQSGAFCDANSVVTSAMGGPKMPAVFSIYNCGTSHNRQNLDETVADLARRTVGAENRDWMINDGPGSSSHAVGKSASLAERSLAAQAKTPGTWNPVTGLKKDSFFEATRGVISGSGWEDNVAHTMAVLNATIDLPRTINMVGWSRGAITCFMIAHALYSDPRTNGIEVNIFAFDPVPGPGNFDDPDKVTLPGNVRRYAAVVQEDERRKIFRPTLIDADQAPGIKTRFYYMPGGHSTEVFRTKSEVALIAAYLAHHFLQKHGTQLQNSIQLTPRDMCELYAKVRIDIAQYQAMGGGILQLLGREHRVVPNRFQDTSYFINDHHASQFRKTFPQIWSALDRGVSANNDAPFQHALKMLQASAPTTYSSLQKTGLIS